MPIYLPFFISKTFNNQKEIAMKAINTFCASSELIKITMIKALNDIENKTKFMLITFVVYLNIVSSVLWCSSEIGVLSAAT